jgi:uncharacterized protein YndB with AHSA1/START domain
MAAIVEEFTIEASPEYVFNALTQQDEIACWWTNDLSVTSSSSESEVFQEWQHVQL